MLPLEGLQGLVGRMPEATRDADLLTTEKRVQNMDMNSMV